MSRPKKDLQIRIGSEVFSMRERESRTFNIPMTLSITGGVLYITQPDVVRQTRSILEELPKGVWLKEDNSESDPLGAQPDETAKKIGRDDILHALEPKY